MLNNFWVVHCGSFCVVVGLFRYLHTPWRHSTKPFMKQLTPCRGMSIYIFVFLPVKYWNMWLSFFGTPKRATIDLEGSAVGKYVIFGKCRDSQWFAGNFISMSKNCPGPYNGSFFMVLGSFRYLCTPWGRSTKPFTKRLGSRRGMSSSIFDFLPSCSPTVQGLPWLVLHDPGLVLIPMHSLRTLHQTVYETVMFL